MEGAVAGQEKGVAGLLGGGGEHREGGLQRPFDLLDAERVAGGGQRVGDRQPVQDAVDGPYPQWIAGAVHQQHQAAVPWAGRRALVPEAQIGGPPVVAVGDECLAGRQVRVDRGDVLGGAQRPQPMPSAVLADQGEQRRGHGGALDQGGGGAAAVAAVGEQQRFEVGGGGAHQPGTVGHRRGHDLLVRQDRALRRVAQPQGADQSALHLAVGEPLFVDVQGGQRIGDEDSVLLPAAQCRGSPDVAGGRVAVAWQDQPYDVVRVGALQLDESVGAHHDVVRWRGDRGEAADPVGGVAQAAER